MAHDVSLILRAGRYAAAAHGDQKRKYTGEPYIVHPLEVARMVTDYGGTDAMICAALLHDVVEDTPTSIESVEKVFGEEIATLVYWLTDISKPQDGNRATRKQKDREHIARAPAEAKTVKLADLVSNSTTILLHDRNFAVVYMKEKQKLLEVLTEGNKELYDMAAKIVEAYTINKGN